MTKKQQKKTKQTDETSGEAQKWKCHKNVKKREQDEGVVEMRVAFKERSLHGQEKQDEDNHRGSEVKMANLKREMSERRGMCVFSASVTAVPCVDLTDKTS